MDSIYSPWMQEMVRLRKPARDKNTGVVHDCLVAISSTFKYTPSGTVLALCGDRIQYNRPDTRRKMTVTCFECIALLDDLV